MKDSIRKGNKVVLTAAHWGLVTGDIALVTEEMDQIHALDKGKGMHDPDAPGVGEMLLNAYDIHAND